MSVSASYEFSEPISALDHGKFKKINYQLSPDVLILQALSNNLGRLNNTGALVVNTGKFTGRSPKDKFIVCDEATGDKVYWNDFNLPIEEKYFEGLYAKMMEHLREREVWMRDAYVCADADYRIRLRVINEDPWSNLFCYNMFLRPKDTIQQRFDPEWQIVHAPSFLADPAVDGVRSENFSIINFSKRTILIGGTAYTGEIKKGMFTVLNHLLPLEKNVLSMHCSANMDASGATTLFFGLSGTGKTTLSADAERKLIGDDEHGWSDAGVFNFEGGCYAKCVDLSAEKEPEIYQAIRHGALVENTAFREGSNVIDFGSREITENTRVSYPLQYISNALNPAIGSTPSDIFFLTCDAYGILPPISKLNMEQAMYHFLSGYTAKIAGTEAGVTEPVSTFSTCFGAPFLPLNPLTYASMLGRKIRENKVNVWLVNTGWTGGAFGTGERISLKYTRAMIKAALDGGLKGVSFEEHPVFKLQFPASCSGVPSEILNPRNTWADKSAYDKKAEELGRKFVQNFTKFKGEGIEALKLAGPVLG